MRLIFSGTEDLELISFYPLVKIDHAFHQICQWRFDRRWLESPPRSPAHFLCQELNRDRLNILNLEAAFLFNALNMS